LGIEPAHVRVIENQPRGAGYFYERQRGLAIERRDVSRDLLPIQRASSPL
jgi:hypothetical protein